MKWPILTWSGLFGEALDALRENGLRTLLSLLGVAIGITSIIVVGSISGSGREIIFRELETFGLRTFWVFRDVRTEDAASTELNRSGIDLSDVRALTNIGIPVARLTPVIELGSRAQAVHGNQRSKLRLQGVNADFLEINGDELAAGRFFDEADIRSHARVTVIGPDIRERLFADITEPLGHRLLLNDQWYEVIGVLRPKSRDLIASLGAAKGEETGARALVPYPTALSLSDSGVEVSYLQGQASDLVVAQQAVQMVREHLTAAHAGRYKYKGESMATYVATANRILGTVSLIGMVAATVSLLVGGLAIMNIMTTSVVERTQEIGLRRAIGASKSAIRLQFLMEAVLVSCAGGAFGVLVGVALVLTIAAITGHPIRPSWTAMGLAVVSTIAVGILSGVYPARRAAELEPVEALRHA